MASERKTVYLVALFGVAVITIILFYYFAVPAILNFIYGVKQFVGSTEFLVGVIVGAFAVIFVIALTQSISKML